MELCGIVPQALLWYPPHPLIGQKCLSLLIDYRLDVQTSLFIVIQV